MSNTKNITAGERTQKTMVQLIQDHPLDSGEFVKIFNTTMGGKVILEGKARIMSRILETPHYYVVLFRQSETFRATRK